MRHSLSLALALSFSSVNFSSFLVFAPFTLKLLVLLSSPPPSRLYCPPFQYLPSDMYLLFSLDIIYY